MRLPSLSLSYSSLFLIPILSLVVSCGKTPADRPNVLLITFESLRADKVGCYGEPLPTTPNIDLLAAEGTLYEQAYSVTSWTLSSHATLFTGLYPSAHQVIEPRDRLQDSYVTLAEVLQGEGYETAGYVSGPFLRSAHALDQGFEAYDDSPCSVTQQAAHDDITNDKMEELLSAFLEKDRAGDKPFFLFAYLWDPHYDFIPPSPYDTMFVPDDAEPFDVTRFEFNRRIHTGMSPGAYQYLLSQYEGEIRCTDDMLGRLWRLMREKGIWENTIVILTADHGEEFFEHGEKGHKNNLHVESLHVPLIIKWDGRAEPERDDRVAGLIDLFPTLVDRLSLRLESPLHGKSLTGPPRSVDDPLFFELTTTFYGRRKDGEVQKTSEQWWAIRRGPFKAISVPNRHVNVLYDVSTDQEERNQVERVYPEILEELVAALGPWQSSMQKMAGKHGKGVPARLSNEELERLKSLGYIGN